MDTKNQKTSDDNENMSWLDERLPPPNENESGFERKKSNITQNFGSGKGLLILVIFAVIVIIFIAIIVRTLTNKNDSFQTEARVEVPETPDNDLTSIPVTPEEARRRQEVANQEALNAAANNTSYQPGFDINMTDQGQQIGSGEFNIDGSLKQSNQAQAASQTNSNANEQFNAAQQAELKRVEDERKAHEELRKREADEWQRQNDARNAYVEQQKALIVADISKILNGNTQKGFSSTVSYLPQNTKQTNPNSANNQPNNTNENAAIPRQEPKQAIFKTGNTIFAVLDSEVNTDASNTVIATVYGGQYNGSKLLGSVQRGNGNIELRFNRLAPQDGRNTLNIDGIAMRTSDASTAVATSINKHTISRYASLIFSNSLAGLGQAAQQQDSTVTQLNNGSTVTSSTSATDKQIIGYVAGSVGAAMANEIGQGFNRQPTYKIARGTSLAVFFMQDVYSD